MRSLLMIAGALALAACQLPSFSVGQLPTQAPAPLQATSIDDTALETAWRGFDAALDAINVLVDAGIIKPKTPKAIAIADAIDRVTAALKAAEHAAAAGSTTSYKTALIEAKSAIADVRSALRS